MNDSVLLGAIGAVGGAVVGRFLNGWIVRLPESDSAKPGSRCPKCGHQPRWMDKVPILSWLRLGGRCRVCRHPMHRFEPLVELAMAVLWAGMAVHFGCTLEALGGAVFGTLLTGIVMTDARVQIIPDEFSLGGLVLGLLFAAVMGGPAATDALRGAAVGFGPLWLIGGLASWLLKKDALGGGDPKMMAMVGAFLGWQGALLTIFLGALTGTLVFAPLRLFSKREVLIPFGVFLAIGAATTYLVGPEILAWYRGYLGVAP
ncbi:MAG: A24 family peptidase [Gemmatimonadota bacterium]